MDAIEALITRRSPLKLVDPAPGDETLAQILHAGMRAPDHGRLRPWRFVVIRGPARERFGEVLAEALRRREPEAAPGLAEREKQKPLRAPMIVVVAAKLVQGHKVPAIEQIVAVGAAAQNIQLAAHALGFGALWRTGAPAYDPHVKAALGLANEDEIVGYLYLGTAAAMPPLPGSPEVATVTREWTGPEEDPH